MMSVGHLVAAVDNITLSVGRFDPTWDEATSAALLHYTLRSKSFLRSIIGFDHCCRSALRTSLKCWPLCSRHRCCLPEEVSWTSQAQELTQASFMHMPSPRTICSLHCAVEVSCAFSHDHCVLCGWIPYIALL